MKDISRSEAIQRLRQFLISLADEETSVCKAAGDHGVFCGGLARWSDDELRARFPWIERFQPVKSRAEFERRANRWLLNRQHLLSERIPCDSAACDHRASPCAGWKEFYEVELSRFCSEELGEPVRVVPDDVMAETIEPKPA